MTDFLTKAERSVRMASVRQTGTKPEIALRLGLHAMGFRYRIAPARLPGRPDIVLPRFGVAVFVHGCFWHGHGCAAGRPPATNQPYWLPKLEANRRRDRRKADALRALGWRVFTVWACQLANANRTARTLERLAKHIRN